LSVTATNFQDAPHSAWGFHHVPELLPTAMVARGSGPVWELPRRDAGLGSLQIALADGSHATLAALAEARPQTIDTMRGISGIGAKKLENYGPALLEILA